MPNGSLQSIRGNVLAAGAALQCWWSALLGAAEPPICEPAPEFRLNWEAIGSVGDAIGGVGVVLTLLYLAHQTRQNTRAVRAASFHQVADSLSDISKAVVQDPSLISLLTRVNEDEESLSPEDTARYGYFLLLTLRRIESLFFHAEQGTIESESWRGTQQTLHFIFGKEVARQWWAENANRFNSSFRSHIDQNVVGPSAASP